MHAVRSCVLCVCNRDQTRSSGIHVSSASFFVSACFRLKNFITFSPMPNFSFLLSSLYDLAQYFDRTDEHETFNWFRELGLLPLRVACKDCGTETELEVPETDGPADIRRRSKCANRQCMLSHGYRRTIFFKRHSIFEHFPQTAMHVIM